METAAHPCPPVGRTPSQRSVCRPTSLRPLEGSRLPGGREQGPSVPAQWAVDALIMGPGPGSRPSMDFVWFGRAAQGLIFFSVFFFVTKRLSPVAVYQEIQ